MVSFVCLANAHELMPLVLCQCSPASTAWNTEDINNDSGLAKLVFVRGHAQLFNVDSIETHLNLPHVGNYYNTVVYI